MHTRSIARRYHTQLLLSLCGLLLIPAVCAAESLLTHVGNQTGFCLHLKNVSNWPERIQASRLFERLDSLDSIRQWRTGRELARLKQTLKEVENLLGVPIDQALREAIGQELVVAIDPNTADRPTGVLLAAPESRAGVQRLLDLWNQLEPAELVQAAEGYWSRSAQGAPTVYYLLEDGLLAISDREEAIREIAVNHKQGGGHPNSLLSAPEWIRASGSISPESWGTVYFRPQLWHDVLPIESSTPIVGPVLRQLARAESMIAGFSLNNELQLQFHILLAPGQLSPVARESIAKWTAPPDFWRSTPSETYLTICGQDGPARLLKLIQTLPETKDRDFQTARSLIRGLLFDLDPIDDVPPRIGKEWGIRILPDPASPLPIGAVAALDFREMKSDEKSAESKASLADGLDNLLKTGLRMWISQTRSEAPDTLTLRSEVIAGHGTLYWVAGLPLGRPAYLVTPERVWVGTTPELVRQALAGSSETVVAQPGDRLSEAHQIVAVNTAGIREFLQTNRDLLLQTLRVPDDQRAVANRTLNRVADILRVCDRVEFGSTALPNEIRLQLSFQALPD